MLLNKGQHIAWLGDGYLFGYIIIQSGRIIGDNIFIGINEHEPFALALFERFHTFEIKIVLSDSMHHEVGIVVKLFGGGFNFGRHKVGIIPNTNGHAFGFFPFFQNANGRGFTIGIDRHNQIS